jgi:hypothetical protein
MQYTGREPNVVMTASGPKCPAKLRPDYTPPRRKARCPQRRLRKKERKHLERQRRMGSGPPGPSGPLLKWTNPTRRRLTRLMRLRKRLRKQNRRMVRYRKVEALETRLRRMLPHVGGRRVLLEAMIRDIEASLYGKR